MRKSWLKKKISLEKFFRKFRKTKILVKYLDLKRHTKEQEMYVFLFLLCMVLNDIDVDRHVLKAELFM